MSFYKLWENIEDQQGQDHGEQHSDKIVDVIRIGNNLDKKFWDHLMQLANNADGLSALLGVSADKVSAWPSKIKEALEKGRQDDLPDKQRLVMTGEDPQISNQGDATY